MEATAAGTTAVGKAGVVAAAGVEAGVVAAAGGVVVEEAAAMVDRRKMTRMELVGWEQTRLTSYLHSPSSNLPEHLVHSC